MKTYLVGGAVRDKLLSYPYSEQDWLVTGSSPEEMQSLGYTPVGKDFPVFLHPTTKEEYALARTERKSAPGYSGFVFHTAPDITLEEDLQRRDLTINAIAEDDSGQLCDPYGGVEDLHNKLLRHVSSAFTEDPVRILRVARFAARYHHLRFTVAVETNDLMHSMVLQGEASHLVPERVWKEWQRAFTESSPQQFIAVLQECGALEVIVPELAQRLELNDEPLQRLRTSLTLCSDSRIRLAVLLCDLNPEDSEDSCRQLEHLCQRLGMPKLERELFSKLSRLYRQALNAEQLPADAILKLLQNLDAFRRPQLLTDFSLCCEIIAKQKQTVFSKLFLLKALEHCSNIHTKDIIAQGISGKNIGIEINRQRHELIEKLLRDEL